MAVKQRQTSLYMYSHTESLKAFRSLKLYLLSHCLQSINQFISRHSTEARATVRLCQIKEKCLKTDFKCVRQFDSSVEESSRVSEQQHRNDEQQCPSCAAELTETSMWMIAANETDCMG